MEYNQRSLNNIWVVVPAYNEDTSIRTVVQELTEQNLNVVVIDDCSNTPQELYLHNLPVHICRHSINLGQGAALRTGFQFALKMNATIVVTFDADGQHTIKDINSLINPILTNETDVTLGSRFINSNSAININGSKKVLLKIATKFMNILLNTKLTDTHNGLRAIRANVLPKLKLSQNGMSHASEIVQEIVRNKIRYLEIPVTIVYTDYSIKKGQKLRNSFNIIWDMALSFLRR